MDENPEKAEAKPTENADENPISEKAMELFESIIEVGNGNSNIFYKSQQIGEAELSSAQKMAILEQLFHEKPQTFLERYHHFIEPEFLSLFDENSPAQKLFLDLIKTRPTRPNLHQIRNRRYLELQKLQAEGAYFSNEKMREREPFLFDMMVGQYLDDREKFHLRPTVELTDTNRSEFSRLLEQLDDSQRVADRRERFLENFRRVLDKPNHADRFLRHVDHRTLEADEEERQIEEEQTEFQMEFDSSDDEGRQMEAERLKQLAGTKKHCAKRDDTFVMRRFRKKLDRIAQKQEDASELEQGTSKAALEADQAVEALSNIHVSTVKKPETAQEADKMAEEAQDWSSGDEDESRPTGFSRQQLRDEFVSMMEQRFLEGKDGEFFDYSGVDAGQGRGNAFDRIRDQDMEDAYFDSEDPD